MLPTLRHQIRSGWLPDHAPRCRDPRMLPIGRRNAATNLHDPVRSHANLLQRSCRMHIYAITDSGNVAGRAPTSGRPAKQMIGFSAITVRCRYLGDMGGVVERVGWRSRGSIRFDCRSRATAHMDQRLRICNLVHFAPGRECPRRRRILLPAGRGQAASGRRRQVTTEISPERAPTEFVISATRRCSRAGRSRSLRRVSRPCR